MNPISYFDLILTPLVHEYKLYIENCKKNKHLLLTACDHSPLSTSFLKLDAFGCMSCVPASAMSTSALVLSPILCKCCPTIRINSLSKVLSPDFRRTFLTVLGFGFCVLNFLSNFHSGEKLTHNNQSQKLNNSKKFVRFYTG